MKIWNHVLQRGLYTAKRISCVCFSYCGSFIRKSKYTSRDFRFLRHASVTLSGNALPSSAVTTERVVRCAPDTVRSRAPSWSNQFAVHTHRILRHPLNTCRLLTVQLVLMYRNPLPYLVRCFPDADVSTIAAASIWDMKCNTTLINACCWRTVLTPANEDAIIETVEWQPWRSSSDIARCLALSQPTNGPRNTYRDPYRLLPFANGCDRNMLRMGFSSRCCVVIRSVF